MTSIVWVPLHPAVGDRYRMPSARTIEVVSIDGNSIECAYVDSDGMVTGEVTLSRRWIVEFGQLVYSKIRA